MEQASATNLSMSVAQLVNEMSSSESVYLKDLSALIACCQFNASMESTALQVDIVINNNLRNIASSLLSSHLYFKDRILPSLAKEQPQTLLQLISWLADVSPLYEQFINYYNFDPDQPDREVYLKKRPLVRIRFITKLLHQLTEQQEMDSELSRTVKDLYETFSHHLSNARDKLDSERSKIALHTIAFDNVKCLEDLTKTASNFKQADVLTREFFQMRLKHPQNLTKLETEVELFALADSSNDINLHQEKENPLIDNVHSLGICSTESLGRSLMFPPFRQKELILFNNQDYVFHFDTSEKEISLIPYYSSLEDPEIIISLKPKHKTSFNLWITIFNKLFSADGNLLQASPTRNTSGHNSSFTAKHNQLLALKNGTVGLNINISEPALPEVPKVAASVSKNLLHRSRPLPPSLPVVQDMKRFSQIAETSTKQNNGRIPLANKTNIQEQVSTGARHAYRLAMSQKLSSHASVSTSNVCALLQEQKVKDSKEPENVEPLTTETLNQVQQNLVESDPSVPAMEVISVVAEQDTIPSTETVAVDDNGSEDQGNHQPIIDIQTAAIDNTAMTTPQPVKRSRRKSILSVFGLIKKSNKTEREVKVSDENTSSGEFDRGRSIFCAPQNNFSNATLTTQETIVHSKSNKNINKLTIDTSIVNELDQPPQFEELSSRKLQTAVTTPGSAVPSPFAISSGMNDSSVDLTDETMNKIKKSKTLCNFNCRVSTWTSNKWHIIGGKEISIKVIVNEEGEFVVGNESNDFEKVLIFLSVTAFSSVRRTTALDIEVKTRDHTSPQNNVVSTLFRCSSGANAEQLLKALELAKKETQPNLSAKDSMSSLNSSMYTSSLSSNSLALKHQFNSMTSIINNNNLADDILSLGKPKFGNGSSLSLSGSSPSTANSTSNTAGALNYANDLYFTPPSSTVDLSFGSAVSTPVGTSAPQNLLLLLSAKIRVHQKCETKWVPQVIAELELFALETMPNYYHIKISETSIDHLIKSDNILRVGKAGVLLSIQPDNDENSSEYMLEFKNKKISDNFHEIITNSR